MAAVESNSKDNNQKISSSFYSVKPIVRLNVDDKDVDSYLARNVIQNFH
jgi:hypothetical protein